MLTHLTLKDFVIVRELSLDLNTGLTVLTGETGAGKSILMDALALALGARSDVGLVRHGCEMASVTAEFDTADSELQTLLNDNGIEFDGTLILRRTLSSDGKSRAWVNDTPISIKTLKQIGDNLVEIHGQFANHTLLNPITHRTSLDLFGKKIIKNYNTLLQQVKEKYNEYHLAEQRLNELTDMLQKSAIEREFLEHNVRELESLNVNVGEEDELATRRTAMMNAEKDAAILSDANTAMNPRGESLDAQIFSVAHILERIKTEPNPYSEQIDALYNAAQIVSDVAGKLNPTEISTDDLDAIEERLFAIRAAARKHRVPADELPQKLEQMSAQLNAIENSDTELKKLRTTVKNARAEFDAAATELTSARKLAAEQMRSQILAELPDLKLGGADFIVQRTETTPSVNGVDEIVFMIKTNPGMPFAPLHRAASGGELARIMLALKSVITDKDGVGTVIYDEIDAGVSGGTARRIGISLLRSSAASQVFCVTHSAQIASLADAHYLIVKEEKEGRAETRVLPLDEEGRINELSRILGGIEITAAQRLAARELYTERSVYKEV